MANQTQHYCTFNGGAHQFNIGQHFKSPIMEPKARLRSKALNLLVWAVRVPGLPTLTHQ